MSNTLMRRSNTTIIGKAHRRRWRRRRRRQRRSVILSSTRTFATVVRTVRRARVLRTIRRARCCTAFRFYWEQLVLITFDFGVRVSSRNRFACITSARGNILAFSSSATRTLSGRRFCDCERPFCQACVTGR